MPRGKRLPASGRRGMELVRGLILLSRTMVSKYKVWHFNGLCIFRNMVQKVRRFDYNVMFIYYQYILFCLHGLFVKEIVGIWIKIPGK